MGMAAVARVISNKDKGKSTYSKATHSPTFDHHHHHHIITDTDHHAELYNNHNAQRVKHYSASSRSSLHGRHILCGETWFASSTAASSQQHHTMHHVTMRARVRGC